jgi:hypothetical protein
MDRNKWKKTVVPENVKNDFEENRRCLVNSYTTNVQTHAGLLIAATIGGLALFSSWKDFWSISSSFLIVLILEIGFSVLIILVIASIVYLTLRTVYWVLYVNLAITLPMKFIYHLSKEAVPEDNEYLPGILMIQNSISQTLRMIQMGRLDYFKLKWYQKAALCLAGNYEPYSSVKDENI